MRILSHKAIEQVGSDADHEGRLFSPVVCLQGEYTLTQLRCVLERELLPIIQQDIRENTYRAVFIEPARAQRTHQCRDAIENETQISNMIHRAGLIYADNRTDSEYLGKHFHVHDGVCTTSICMRGGYLPTVYVQDEGEFLDVMRDSTATIADLLGDELPTLLEDDASNRGQRAATVAEIFQSRFSAATKEQRGRLHAAEERIKGLLTRVIRRTHGLGHISVFAGGMLHAADTPQKNAGTPGQLFVKHWGSVR